MQFRIRHRCNMSFFASTSQTALSATLFLLVANRLYKRTFITWPPPRVQWGVLQFWGGMNYTVYGWFLWKPSSCLRYGNFFTFYDGCFTAEKKKLHHIHTHTYTRHPYCTSISEAHLSCFCRTNVSRRFARFILSSLRRLNCLQISPFREFLVTYIPQTREEAVHGLEVTFVDCQSQKKWLL